MTEKNSPSDNHRAKMAVPVDAPSGLELDSKGNPIPLAQRTKDDQDKAAAAKSP